MRKIEIIRHHTNPLHVYCRLVDIGISAKTARTIARVYEILFYWILKEGGDTDGIQ